MSDLRYLGLVVGRLEASSSNPEGAAGRDDPRLGRFVAFDEPLPVGTELLADERPFRVSRVDETLGGFWVRPAGAAAGVATSVPTEVVPEPTVRDPVPEAAPPTTPDGEGRGRKRRRKTVIGR